MKQLISIIITILAIGVNSAAAQLRFESPEWDFGTVAEADGRVSHTFTGENTGDAPLVILDVVTTCGCTVPDFSRQPLRPGDRTQITVTFDPAGRPGLFEKTLAVYSTERQRVATLTVRGQVVPRPRSIEELYPVDAGGGVRLSSTLCAFSYIYSGVEKSASIDCTNTSPQPVRLELRPRTTSGLLHVKAPGLLAPGERASIELRYLNPAETPRYGTVSDALEVTVDGASRGTTILAHAIGTDNPASRSKEMSPKAEISENMIKFGVVKRRGGPRERHFALKNAGAGELVVRAAECGEGIATDLVPGTRITPGDERQVVVRFDPATRDYGAFGTHLTIVTDDPQRPMRRLRVTAIVEE